MTERTFLDTILKNPYNRALLARLNELELPQTFLTAGCLFQTVWNVRAGQPPTASINDCDVFYFDESDSSFEGEDIAIRRAAELFADVPVHLELRNQARVHLWFQNKFGEDCPRLNSSEHAISRFLVLGTCVGVNANSEVFSPFGLNDLADGLLRPNPVNSTPELYRRKVASYRQRWPWLKEMSS